MTTAGKQFAHFRKVRDAEPQLRTGTDEHATTVSINRVPSHLLQLSLVDRAWPWQKPSAAFARQTTDVTEQPRFRQLL